MKKVLLFISLLCLFQHPLFGQNNDKKYYQLNDHKERKTPFESQLKYKLSNIGNGSIKIASSNDTIKIPIHTFSIDIHFDKLQYNNILKVSVKKNTLQTEALINNEVTSIDEEDLFLGKTIPFVKRQNKWKIPKISIYNAMERKSLQRYLDELNHGKNDRLQDFIYPDKMYIGQTIQINKSSVNHFFDIPTVTAASGNFTLRTVRKENGEDIAVFDVDFQIKGHSELEDVALEFKGTIKRSISKFYDTEINVTGRTTTIKKSGQKEYTQIPCAFVLSRKLW